MLSGWRWKLLQIVRRLWVRATLIGLLGALAALLAAFAERFLPWQLPGRIGAQAVDDILNIIASSMLAVTTFSLSVMTAAFSAATSNVTPRATRLLMQDQSTQNVLATFIGSFLFSLVGIVMLKTGLYGEQGRVILFVATLAVIALIVVTLIRWIDHLTRLGRVGETTDRVEAATRDAIDAYLETPSLGGRPLPLDAPPPAGIAINAAETGYVQHVDTQALATCAETLDAEIRVAVLPGAFVHPSRVLLWANGANAPDDDMIVDLRACFTIAPERTYDQDPRFGLAVMSEIASRALSPAVNDSGTAIDVIGRQTRLLIRWAQGADAGAKDAEVALPRLLVPAIAPADLFDDAFTIIGRDGADRIEVQIRLQKALHALAETGSDTFRQCARAEAQSLLARALEALTFQQDADRLKATAVSLNAGEPR